MKKGLIILFVCILIIYIFNIKFVNDIYYIVIGNYYYNNLNYNKSITYHKNIVSSNKNFFLGGDYYKLGKYRKSLEVYNKVLNSDFKEKYRVYNNIGNIYYKLGENIIDIKQKLDFFYKSKEKYKQSLDLRSNNKAKNNYFFILQKIKSLEKLKNKKEEKKENNINSSLNINNSLKTIDEEKINNYIEKLKKEEKYNRQFLNIRIIDNSSDLINSYFYEKLNLVPSDSSILEKDW